MTRDDELAALRARVSELEAAEHRPPRSRVKSTFAVVLVLLAALLTPLSVVAVWSNALIGDTDRYVQTMAPLADDPDVQGAVANRVTTAVMQQIDVDDLLGDVAPADRPRLEKALGAASGPITSGLTSLVHNTAEKFVASSAFATVWNQLNRTAHAAVDKALTGNGGGAVKVENGEVTLDLAPVVEKVKQALVDQGLTVAGKIPEVHTSITVMQSTGTLAKARTGFRLLQLLSWVLPLIVLVLAAGAVLLARRRRRALITAALAVAVGALVLGLALWIGRAVYLDALPPDVSRAAAGSVYDTLVRFLRTAVRVVAVLGAVVALASWLGGPGRWARAVRGAWTGAIGSVRDATNVGTFGPVGPWVHRMRRWLNWTVAAVAAAVLIAWNYPTGAVVAWIAVCAVCALAVIEFLDAPALPGPDPSEAAAPPAAPAR
ncbi:hypothetical protein GTY65_33065 [Streptomyces sp. SID8379]|uniref:hypothetical protein n=1 Tax=unclassified Streptomyces TaxID=2593676 RepID=UPI0006862C23|nr:MULTISPECIES: hypothetical protein [unclassified Streptomyces]MYW68871.1 hypothetical protein [Streptomyces sp. SID8379]